jgi:sugar O-acyltransferase (sialic acid O-acetyltransferase NeuD family)
VLTHPPVAVYGSGGFAREVAWLAEVCGHEVVCFIDDDPSKIGRRLNEIPVVSLDVAASQFPQALVAAGIGSPAARATVTGRVVERGLRPATLIHPRVERSRWITVGTGIVICAGNILTTNIVVGDHVQINLDCTIGHDVTLDEFATLAPGVHVSGCVRIGRRAYIGTGAAIINGTLEHPLVVGDDAVVGAGACVTRSVDAGVTVVGVPAKPLAKR